MYNIIKQQDELKNAPDDRLKLYMSSPNGLYPQYLVMAEMQRREKMRAEFEGGPPKTTMAEEMSGDTSEQGEPNQQGEQPQEDPSQAVDPNAQGLMGLPNDTTAGAVMKSRISGQPQMAGDMVANAPQAMAVGGPVASTTTATAPRMANPFANNAQNAPQFGGIFGGGAAGSNMFGGAAPTTYANPGTSLPVYAQPPAQKPEDQYKSFIDKFNASGKGGSRGASRTQQSNPKPIAAPRGLNLPAGMAAPTYGTPGLNRTFTGREGRKTQYSWANDAARDAYIRYMTPPAKASAPVTKADGGPIRMFAGGDFPSGPTNQFSDEDLQRAANSPDPELRITALNEMKRRNSQSRIERGLGAVGRGANQYFGALGTAADLSLRGPGMLLEGAGNEIGDIASYLGGKGTQLAPAPTPALPTGGPRTDPPAVSPPAPAGANAPQTRPAQPPAPPAAPPSAGVSGLPPKGTPASGGLADLLKQFEGNGATEDYMGQMRALLEKQRGDPAALASQDKNAALMQASLALMGSKNPNLMGAISESAVPAMQAYEAKRAERVKDDRALTATEMEALGISAKMSQSERADAQARAIAIDNARREDEAAAFKYGPEAAETIRHNKAVESAYASRAGDALDTREYLADLKTKATIEGTPVFRRTQEQKDFLINFAAKYAAINGGGGGGGMTAQWNAQYDPLTGQRTQ